MNQKPPLEDKEFSVKIELPLKILPFKVEFKYKKKTYLEEIKSSEPILVRLDKDVLVIVRRDAKGRISWVVLNETLGVGEL